jgi:type IV pilus assembly protein PilA
MKKAFTLIEIMIVVVIIALLAVMAVPAFNKVRAEAREKTIIANLHLFAAAGKQYLADKAVTRVGYTQLRSDRRLSELKPVADENYSQLTVSRGGMKLAVTASGGKRIAYTYE